MNKAISLGIICLFLTVTVIAHPGGHAQDMPMQFQTPVAPAAMPAGEGDFIRLVAGLDEPDEFYCFDLAGWGKSLKLDDPLQTHTCKIKGGADQMFFFESDKIKVDGYDRCVQAGGSSGLTLPGSAVLARECSDEKLQNMSLQDDGTIRINDTEFCLGAGPVSEPASGPSHMWRTLTVVNCGADKSLTRWQVGLK